jgi:beta-lactam-binding protein with PASTA domain
VRTPHRPGWLTVAIAGAGGFLCGVLLIAILGGAKGVTRTTTDTVARTTTVTVDPRPVVPDVVGRRLDDARNAVEAAGLRSDVVDDTLFGVIDPSHFDVVDQDPPGGTHVAPDTHVVLTVERR